ncbi:hypothetical protein, partial [Halobacterium salinarum]|uniref:hypothetical protein n=1 Tax=Halobacterium salinarum TaxID=2242 RepID=UPI003904AA48
FLNRVVATISNQQIATGFSTKLERMANRLPNDPNGGRCSANLFHRHSSAFIDPNFHKISNRSIALSIVFYCDRLAVY